MTFPIWINCQITTESNKFAFSGEDKSRTNFYRFWKDFVTTVMNNNLIRYRFESTFDSVQKRMAYLRFRYDSGVWYTYLRYMVGISTNGYSTMPLTINITASETMWIPIEICSIQNCWWIFHDFSIFFVFLC